jgi:hypothetical protein
MTRPPDGDEDLLIERLLGRLPAKDPAAGECPDEAALTAWLEGRSPPAGREAVEGHLARCDECLAVAAALRAERAAPGGRVLTLWRRAPVLTAAAALFLGIALGVLWTLQRRSGTGTDDQLAEAAGQLARAHPGSFGDFHPLTREERRVPRSVQRGDQDPVAIAPASKILEDRPTFRWRALPGCPGYRLEVRVFGGEPKWTLVHEVAKPADDGEVAVPYPGAERELAAGARYEWIVSGEGPLGRRESRQVFGVADLEERAAWDRDRAACRSAAPPRIADLLEAHLAVRRGYLLEAEQAARRQLAVGPADGAARETLYYILRRLDSPESEALAPDADR